MTRLLLVAGVLVLAACTATPIPLPGNDLGFPPARDAGYGGLDAATTGLERGMPPPSRDSDAKNLCDLCWSGTCPCSDAGACDGLRDGALDGLPPPSELGPPGELGATKDAGLAPDQPRDLTSPGN